MARVVHLAEPAALRPSAPPLLVSPLTGTVAHGRACRAKGELAAAAEAYRAVLRDPDHEDAPVARHELALVQQALGHTRDAERAFRWLLRRWPDGRAVVAYNLGSLCEREGRWSQARAAFERALAETPAKDAARVGGCHFHLGEIALAAGEPDRARSHFEQAIAALPDHAKARARLDSLAAI
jgi:tetratricopeptide (TPR) repeat protein